MNRPLVLLAVVLALLIAPEAQAQSPYRVRLPFVEKPLPTPTNTPSPTPEPGCQAIPGAFYEQIPFEGPPTGIAAAQHPDLNLAVRGWEPSGAPAALVDYSGGTDPNAMQLPGLFPDRRTPAFTSTHRVRDWDWPNFRPGPPLSSWPATLLGMAVTPGEIIHVPTRGPDIYQGRFHALVLYASTQRITLKYGREDNIAPGYGVHIDNICVEPSLLTLYNAANAAGRPQLPAVASGQAIGRARSTEILAAIRDTGSFMDPRSRKDWWQGRLAA